MYPSDSDFWWDDDDDPDGNVRHIAVHGVTPTEAEDAILDPRRVQGTVRSSTDEPRQAIIGMTPNGRILCVVYKDREGAVYVITAFPADDRDKRKYRRGRR